MLNMYGWFTMWTAFNLEGICSWNSKIQLLHFWIFRNFIDKIILEDNNMFILCISWTLCSTDTDKVYVCNYNLFQFLIMFSGHSSPPRPNATQIFPRLEELNSLNLTFAVKLLFNEFCPLFLLSKGFRGGCKSWLLLIRGHK